MNMQSQYAQNVVVLVLSVSTFFVLVSWAFPRFDLVPERRAMKVLRACSFLSASALFAFWIAGEHSWRAVAGAGCLLSVWSMIALTVRAVLTRGGTQRISRESR